MNEAPMKPCAKCGESLPLTAFYAHPLKRDGRMGACMTCHRAAVRTNRQAKRTQYAAYERERFRRPERRAQISASQRRMRERNPEKRAARIAVGNALRGGRLSRSSCSDCGSTVRVQAHHSDYSKPLDVTWLCFRCHREHAHHQRTAA